MHARRGPRVDANAEAVAGEHPAGRVLDVDEGHPRQRRVERQRHGEAKRESAGGGTRARVRSPGPTRKASSSRPSACWGGPALRASAIALTRGRRARRARRCSSTTSAPPCRRSVNTVGRSGRAAARSRAHALEVGADVRREVDLVDDEQIGLERSRGRACAGCRRRPRRRSRRASGRRGRWRTWRRGCRRRDSISTTSSGPCSRSSRSAAAMFIEGSSRIAVCGQAPVSTPTTSSGAISPPAWSRSASSFVTRSFVITATRKPRSREQRQQPLDQPGLARADRAADADPDRLGASFQDVERAERHALIGSHVQSSPSTSTR